MKIVPSVQLESVADPVRSKFAMVVPVIEALLHSIKLERLHRLGGIETWTLADLAREQRQGDGDTGICFEYAVHEAISREDHFLYPLASEVLERFCDIGGGAESLLFGPEKDGVIPIVESVQDALTDESRLYVGNRGHPPKLKRYIPQIVRAFRRNDARDKLPRSINGIWKADLFLGNPATEKWVGVTVKSNSAHLQGAQGLRVGIYPKVSSRDVPRRDDDLNLVRLPIPYDGDFMELFYKSFYLVRAFLAADARVPRPVDLPDAEDRFVTDELSKRRDFPILDVLEVIRRMSQEDLLAPIEVNASSDLAVTASISEERGLQDGGVSDSDEFISLAPEPRST